VRYVRPAAPSASLPVREFVERSVLRVWAGTLLLLLEDLEVKNGSPVKPRFFREAAEWFASLPDCAAALCAVSGTREVTLYAYVEARCAEVGRADARVSEILRQLREGRVLAEVKS
jgi:hypothetical protein